MSGLVLTGVHAYYGRAHILADVSLSVGAGEVLALIGRNGAGKSTTLKTVMGLVRASSGEIAFAGTRIDRLPPHRVARLGLGYVPEDRRVFAGLTALENLEVGRRPPREGEGWTPERLFRLFPNLAALKDRPAGRISGGEQQMLAIARTLMGNPSLLLLDEPSEGLAPAIVQDMALTILELKREGVGVLLSEQNLRFAAAVADRAVVIEKGAVRFTGPMRALMEDGEVRRRYLTI
jgi:branched-chain amino acid transport system ATP-binding protein